ncbi:MAG: enolase C-terminal domain-like protein [Acidobacteriota bacterium]
MRITGLDTFDVRFPTSDQLNGSDAMHTGPDYSAAGAILRTDEDGGLEGHGFTFTIGRGNEVCVSAIQALAPLVIDRDVEALFADMAGFCRQLTSDSQLRWLGPEVGVIQLASGAVINAVWDLYAKVRGKPLWKLLVDLSPEELVALIDFRWITDALQPEEAQELLRKAERGRAAREAELRRDGFPAYVTSAGWLGYPDEKVWQLCRDAVRQGFSHIKMKVGLSVDDDVRRAAMIRDTIGPQRRLSMDANQVWSVPEAITHVARLADFDPWWIEEPTSPHDVLGHAAIAKAIAPIGVATGEHVPNRVVFKQLFQAGAIRFCQIDVCRLGGVNEVLAVLVLAAKFGVPVCPHAGGVGLCELVQHISWFDYIAVSADLTDRTTEFADHLHEHFVDPAVVVGGRYRVPTRPGFSTAMRPESMERYRFPDGPVWTERRSRGAP